MSTHGINYDWGIDENVRQTEFDTQVGLGYNSFVLIHGCFCFGFCKCTLYEVVDPTNVGQPP